MLQVIAVQLLYTVMSLDTTKYNIEALQQAPQVEDGLASWFCIQGCQCMHVHPFAIEYLLTSKHLYMLRGKRKEKNGKRSDRKKTVKIPRSHSGVAPRSQGCAPREILLLRCPFPGCNHFCSLFAPLQAAKATPSVQEPRAAFWPSPLHGSRGLSPRLIGSPPL